MSYFLLSTVSLFNAAVLLLLRVLDFAQVTSKQKLFVIKFGLVMIIIMPIIFYTLSYLSLHPLEIFERTKFINKFTASSLKITTRHSPINWTFFIFTSYLMGVTIMLVRILFSFVSASKQLRHSKLAILQGQQVFLNGHIQSPLCFGFPKAKIYFPANIEKNLTAREIQMCLTHEKIHLNQHDFGWKFLSLIIQAIIFFAPWSYCLHRRFELEMEIFCDEITCAKTNADVNEYATLLLGMTSASTKNIIFTHLKTSNLKRRILAMKSKKTPRPLLITILTAALFLTGSAAIATTVSGIKQNDDFKITTKLFIDGELSAAPQIFSHANQEATISLTNKDQDLSIKLIATDMGNNNIKLSYDIKYVNGTDKIHSSPEVIVTPKQESIIKIATDSKHSYLLKVLAEKIPK